MIWLFRIAASVILGLWMVRSEESDSVSEATVAFMLYILGVFCALMALHPASN